MPEIGEIKTSKELNKKGWHKYIYAECPQCHEQRWLLKRKYLTPFQICPSCSNKTKHKRTPSISVQSERQIKVLYLENGLSSLKIAECLNLRLRIVTCAVSRMKISRTFHQAANLALEKGRLNPPRGNQSPNWKGGRVNHQGYIYVYAPNHPRATKTNPYVPEHIIVWEQSRNQKLPIGWVVHHINGVKSDNQPENLIAYPKKKHDKLIPEIFERMQILEIQNNELKQQVRLVQWHIKELQQTLNKKEALNGNRKIN